MRSLYCLCTCLFVSPALFGQEKTPTLAADLVVLNAKVWTVNKKQPEAEALAVIKDRIVFVGSTEKARKLVGVDSVVLDLAGKRIVPGFPDSPVHLLAGGIRLSQVALKDAADEKAFGKRLVDFDKRLPAGVWMLGGDWDHDRTFGGQLPTAAMLDRYVPDRPVFLRRYDGHMALVNTHVLRLAGIDAKTPDPIDRKSTRLNSSHVALS